jgi:hypothetical protein
MIGYVHIVMILFLGTIKLLVNVVKQDIIVKNIFMMKVIGYVPIVNK